MPETFFTTLRFTLLLESAVKEEGMLHVAQRHLQISTAEVSKHSEVLLLIARCGRCCVSLNFRGTTTKWKRTFYARGVFRGNWYWPSERSVCHYFFKHWKLTQHPNYVDAILEHYESQYLGPPILEIALTSSRSFLVRAQRVTLRLRRLLRQIEST